MRNASGQQGENERQWEIKVNMKTWKQETQYWVSTYDNGLSVPWWHLLDIFVIILQEHFVYGMWHGPFKLNMFHIYWALEQYG